MRQSESPHRTHNAIEFIIKNCTVHSNLQVKVLMSFAFFSSVRVPNSEAVHFNTFYLLYWDLLSSKFRLLSMLNIENVACSTK